MLLENYQISCEKWSWGTTPNYEKVYDLFYLIEYTIPGYPNPIITLTTTLPTTGVRRCVEIIYGSDYSWGLPIKRITLNRSNLQSGASCWLHSPDGGISDELVLSVANHPTAQEIANEFNKYTGLFTARVLKSGYFATAEDTGFGGRYYDMQPPTSILKNVIPNFFSEDDRTLIETINLKDYLIDIGNLNYSFDNSDNEGGKNSLYFEDADISFTTSGIKNNSYLKEFFGINEDTSYLGYLIKIYKDTVLIFKGIVNQDSIEKTFGTSSDSEQIKFQALGMLKEFKNFYVNKPLVIPEVLRANGSMLFKDLLNELFNSTEVGLVLDNDVMEYYVTHDPYLEKKNSTTKAFRLRKTGFQRIWGHGENCWDFLNKLCNVMGWVFYSYNDKFYLRNRSAEVLIPSTLDYNKFLNQGYTAIKTTASTVFDNIVIMDGQFYGGAGAGFGDIRRGYGFHIFTSINDDAKNCIPFNSMFDEPYFKLHFVPGRWQKYYSETTDSWTYMIVEDALGGRGGSKYVLDKEKTLFLDGGNTGEIGWVYDTANGINRPQDAIDDAQIGDTDVYWTGNYGGCLFKVINEGTWQMYYDYVKSSLFKNNFLKYINTNANNKINVRYNGTEINPLVKYTIINNPELEGEWTINSLQYDFKQEETSMELQLKLED